MSTDTLIIGFDPAHATRIIRVWRAAAEQEKPTILALDLELEWLLTAEGIPFRSGNELANRSSAQAFIDVEQWTTKLLASDEWRALTFKDQSVMTVYSLSLIFYLMQISYYLPIVPAKKILVCATRRHATLEGIVLSRDPAGALVRVARLHAEHVGVLEDTSTEIAARHAKRAQFTLARALFGWGIGVSNALLRILPRKSIRILASENWHNIEELFAHLPDAELTLLDRAQVSKIPFRPLLRHRMQFIHSDKYAARITDEISELQTRARTLCAKLPPLVIGERNITSLAEEALQAVVTFGIPQVVREMAQAHAMLTQRRPDVVLLRASVSAQPHFAALAVMARALGIPSLELQHGLEYLGPGSISKAHTAEYIAVYGRLVQNELRSLGYPPEKLPVVGSPRFDSYAQVPLTHAHESRSVLIIVPDTITPTLDSYQIFEYYQNIAHALASVPGVHAIIKLRPGPEREAFHRRAIAEAFAGVSYEIAQYESMRSLCERSALMITCYSTVVLEALVLETLVVLPMFSPNEAGMITHHFSTYERAGALQTAVDTDQLSQIVGTLLDDDSAAGRQRTDARAFLEQEYSFDGLAAERLRNLILELKNP